MVRHVRMRLVFINLKVLNKENNIRTLLVTLRKITIAYESKDADIDKETTKQKFNYYEVKL